MSGLVGTASLCVCGGEGGCVRFHIQMYHFFIIHSYYNNGMNGTKHQTSCKLVYLLIPQNLMGKHIRYGKLLLM